MITASPETRAQDLAVVTYGAGAETQDVRDAFLLGYDRGWRGGRAWAPEAYPTHSKWFSAWHAGYRAGRSAKDRAWLAA